MHEADDVPLVPCAHLIDKNLPYGILGRLGAEGWSEDEHEHGGENQPEAGAIHGVSFKCGVWPEEQFVRLGPGAISLILSLNL
jgi:hypothetical protein